MKRLIFVLSIIPSLAVALSGIPVSPALGQSTSNGNMSVTVTACTGTVVSATEAGATRLQDYIGPNFTMQNYQANLSLTLPNIYGVNVTTTLRVYFRPDSIGSRREAVFETGQLDPVHDAATAAADDTQAINVHPCNGQTYGYSVQIFDGATLLATVPVANHWYHSRWRWQSAQRPIVNNAAYLIANKLIPPYGVAPGGIQWSDGVSGSYTIPMSNAGVTQGMGTTGERVDIGLTTGWAATWALVDSLTNAQLTAMTHPGYTVPTDAATEASMRATAETSGTVPWIYRDINTGAPLNMVTYPQASTNTQQSYASPRVWANGLPTFTPDANPPVPVTMTASSDASGVMTVSAIASGTLSVGQAVFGSDADLFQILAGNQFLHPNFDPIPSYTTISAQLTGTAGGVGTYQLARANGLPLQAWTSRTAYAGDPNTGYWTGAAGSFDSGWAPDICHFPALSPVAYMATGDPYFLEGAQFEAVAGQVATAEASFGPGQDARFPSGAAIPYYQGGTRCFAWIERSILWARKATQLAESYGTLPNWLVPSSTWATMSNNAATFFQTWVNNTTPAGTQFSAAFHVESEALYQVHYLSAVLNMAQYWGYSEWNSAATWTARGIAWMADGAHGWPPALSTIEGILYGPGFVFSGNTTTDPSCCTSGQYFSTWGDLWNKLSTYPPGYDCGGTTTVPWASVCMFLTTAQFNALLADPTNGGHMIVVGLLGLYPSDGMRGALAFAAYNGNTVAKTALTVQDPYIADGGFMAAQWALSTPAGGGGGGGTGNGSFGRFGRISYTPH